MDTVTKARRSYIMSRIKSQHTGPELAFKRMLDTLDVDYRMHAKDLPGKPDFVLPDVSVVIQVHGCFFHGCPSHYKVSKSNVDFWAGKITRNQERDRRVDWRLRKRGWRVWHFWEHSLASTDRAGRTETRLKRLLADVYRPLGFKLHSACHASPSGVL